MFCLLNAIPSGVSASEFRNLLPTEHANVCGWKENPCSDKFCSFRSISLTECREQVEHRMSNLFESGADTRGRLRLMVAFLSKDFDYQQMSNIVSRNKDPVKMRVVKMALDLFDRNKSEVLKLLQQSVTLPIPLKIDNSSNNASEMSPVSNALGESRDIVLRNAFILTIYGWTLKPDRQIENTDISTEISNKSEVIEVCCEICGRSYEYMETKDYVPFNAILQHRFFCPLIAGNHQDLKDRPGWEQHLCNIIDGCSSKEYASTETPIPDDLGKTARENVSIEKTSTNVQNCSTGSCQSIKQDPSDVLKRIQKVFSAMSGSPYSSMKL